MDSLSKSILLEGLKHEQAQCLRFIAEANRNPQIREGAELHWAMKSAIEVYRAVRSDQLDYRTAVERYCEITRITTAYGTAAYMALEFVSFVPTTAAQIALRNDLLGITRKDAA